MEPTNETRALRIDEMMERYCWVLERRRWMRDEDDLKDMLTDLMHLCNRDGVDFDDILRTARMNYEAEIEEEE